MKYDKLTTDQIERIFAEDVLGWEYDEAPRGYISSWKKPDGNFVICDPEFYAPLTNLDHAMLGLEKLIEKNGIYSISRYNLPSVDGEGIDIFCVSLTGETPEDFVALRNKDLNAAIVEACIRISRPDLFEETDEKK